MLFLAFSAFNLEVNADIDEVWEFPHVHLEGGKEGGRRGGERDGVGQAWSGRGVS